MDLQGRRIGFRDRLRDGLGPGASPGQEESLAAGRDDVGDVILAAQEAVGVEVDTQGGGDGIDRGVADHPGHQHEQVEGDLDRFPG